ncbi:hypothetical protein IJD15_01500 [bacterium]|nr:hypothetical protein [bacterium]
MKKIIKTIIANVLIFACLITIIEVSIWGIENEILRRQKDSFRAKGLLKFHSGIKHFKFDPKYFPSPETGWGRAPEGLEFKSKPIVLFGCSYAYGYNLEKEQTLSYKLAYLTKRPIYNRAFSAWGIQHMLLQAENPDTYKLLPEPEYVIFTFINDHFRRLYVLTFMRGHMLNEDFNLRYKEKDEKLIQIKNQNHFFNFIKRLYLTNIIYNNLYIEKIKLKYPNYKEYHNFALKHFIQSKKEMEKYWDNTKYVVYFYDSFYKDDELKEKLEKENFTVITNKELTSEDITNSKYMTADYHPTEDAWNLLVPKLAERLNLK